GGVNSKVLILGVVYFVASEALELVENLGIINDFSGKTKLYLVLPVAFLDSWFILWIFSSFGECNTPKLGRSGIWVWGVLLHRSTTQDIYRTTKNLFENDTLDLTK
ncbi:transmembrane protein 87B-like protein, partial [Tanacetum coccineum]